MLVREHIAWRMTAYVFVRTLALENVVARLFDCVRLCVCVCVRTFCLVLVPLSHHVCSLRSWSMAPPSPNSSSKGCPPPSPWFASHNTNVSDFKRSPNCNEPSRSWRRTVPSRGDSPSFCPHVLLRMHSVSVRAEMGTDGAEVPRDPHTDPDPPPSERRSCSAPHRHAPRRDSG